MTPKTLSQILAIDAATCAGVFALGVFATGAVAGLSGLPGAIVSAAGWICLAAGALLAWLVVRPARAPLWLVIVGNIGWVAASLAVWMVHSGTLTAIGHALLLTQAAGVALFALLEIRGAASLEPRPTIA